MVIDKLMLAQEIERVNLEVQSAERDYDLNRAAELKYGTLTELQKQLREAEAALEAKASSASVAHLEAEDCMLVLCSAADSLP